MGRDRRRVYLKGGRLALAVILAATVLLVPERSPAEPVRGLKVVALDKASGEKKEVPLYSKSYAVIIGIDQYQNLKFDQQLSYAVRDAKGVEAVLRKNFRFDRIIPLYNKGATKDNILKVLSGELSGLSENDAVFVFWAGHGYTEKTSFGDLGYLIPFDGTFNSNELYKNISMTAIKDDVSKRIPAKHVFYVMDACYSGLLVATRGADRKTGRDLEYLQQITREKVRQVLTAGDKDQEVLDGGPGGHSVFTGRLIEILENAEDFITASEVSALLKEKVFSDARTRNHTQTPKSGELFGLGDYVFIPSLERKTEDTQAKLAAIQTEIEKLQDLEKAASKANDERAKRQAEIEKKAALAKLKSEQLRQQGLEEERRKREQEEKERIAKEQELARKKEADDIRLAALKKEVAEKRKFMGGATLSSLTPEATLTEMQEIDTKIEEIKKSFRQELANGIRQIAERINGKFEKLANARKDEFESEAEFKARIEKGKREAGQEQTREISAFEKKIEEEYKTQVDPFIESLKKLSGNEFDLASGDLELELQSYDGVSNTYLVTIRSRKPIKGIQVAVNGNIPIPREEARVFKQHFENNILRAEIKGNFQSTGFFRVSQAHVIDDASNKRYDLFSSKFVDLGNGIVFDSMTKLLWARDGNLFLKKLEWNDARFKCWNLNVSDISGWRMPTREELKRMISVVRYKEINPFINVQEWYWTKETDGNYGYNISLETGRIDRDHLNKKIHVWPVKGE